MASDFVPWAVERGCVVVDESGYWRMDPKVPLVIPEVNPDAVQNHQGIIASPNCSTTQMVVAMKPLHDAGRIRRVVVSTYQATSGAGVGGQRDLDQRQPGVARRQAAQVRDVRPPDRVQPDPADRLAEARRATPREEMKMVYETHKIMGDDSIHVCPTCVRVPVTQLPQREHPGRDRAEDHGRRSPRAVRRRSRASWSSTIWPNGKYPMPSDCDGDDEVFIGRIREDLSSDNGLAFWCVSDNLRKGAATNAVQIAELLVRTQAAV